MFRPMQHPDNIWSLLGYVECLHKLGKHDDAMLMQGRLDLAAARGRCLRSLALSSPCPDW